jgi:fermentation-respiration switch protein FrsA (DUF1100 family)
MNARIVRERVTFDSGGYALAGYLYRPATRVSGPLPCLIMAHGFAGTMDRLFRYAERFAEVGIAVLSFDYRNFGASGGTHRQVIEMDGQLDDWRAAIGFARSRDDLDAHRLALWGSSLGGGHAIKIATEDGGMAAVIAQVPWLGDPRTAAEKIRMLLRPNLLRLSLAAIRDARRGRQGRPPILVPVYGPPGSVAMFTDGEVEQVLQAYELTDDSLWRNEFAARVALTLPRYNPVRHVEQLTAPLLLCVTSGDHIATVDQAWGVADRSLEATVRVYEGRHFQIYYGPIYERVITDQIDFLRAHLVPSNGRTGRQAGGPDGRSRRP